MTREEIIEGLKLLEDNMVHFDELQNNKGEWIDVHELLFEVIQTLEQEPTYYPPCQDCNKKMDEIRRIYDKIKEQEPCDDAQERYKDLCEYFGDAKDILKSREDFKAWLERVKWHIRKAEELYEKYEYKKEPCDEKRDCSTCKYEEYSSNYQPCRDCRTLLENYTKWEQKERELPSVTQKSETVTEFADRCRECGKMRKGHWIYDETIDNWRCSKCNETPKTMGYVGTADFMAEHFKFCNHCGAKMESEE